MRILLVHDYGTLSGGAELMIWSLREGLRARGHEVVLFTSTARPLPLVVVADETCFGTTGPLRKIGQAANPSAWWRLRQVMEGFRPDVVHVKMFLTQLSPLILPLLRHVPSLLHLVNYNLVCPLNTKRLPDGAPCHHTPGPVCHATGCMSWMGVARRAVQWRLTDLGVFKRILANSRWVMERNRAEGIRVDGFLYNGVPVRDRRPPLGEVPQVGFAGRLVPKKGVDRLVRAMSLVVRLLPEARLVVAGDGPERPRLESLAGELGIAGSVAFLGHVPRAELEELLGPVWVQAIPSLWEEPFGLVAAEAMMRGTAVVATSSGGLTELVTPGVTGLLTPPGDVEGLAAALVRILTDREAAERFGAAGRGMALRELTEAHHVEQCHSIYQSMLVGSAP